MKAVRLVGLFIAIASASLLAQSTSVSQMMQVRHWNGQSVAPVYEGFDINADGSYNMWFGYMNRNEEESIDIPTGAANAFEPGGDRGGDGAKQRQPSELEFVDPHRDVVGVLDEERLLGDNPQSEVLQDRKYVGEHDRISGAVNA